jgi:hypothetical protein
MTPRTPQGEVFYPFLLNSKDLGVLEDSKSPTLGGVSFILTLGQSGVATTMVTQLDEGRRRLWEVAKANLEKAHKRYKDFVDKSRRKVKFQEGDEVWLNIKNFRLPEGLSHKFLGPYAGPFKVLEKKLSNTYKLELPENLRIHPTFHVSLLKPVSRDASRPNREYSSRPPPDLVHNELEFEVEAVLKSRQLRGREREYLVK